MMYCHRTLTSSFPKVPSQLQPESLYTQYISRASISLRTNLSGKYCTCKRTQCNVSQEAGMYAM